jgi:hypothetical protein
MDTDDADDDRDDEGIKLLGPTARALDDDGGIGLHQNLFVEYLAIQGSHAYGSWLLQENKSACILSISSTGLIPLSRSDGADGT